MSEARDPQCLPGAANQDEEIFVENMSGAYSSEFRIRSWLFPWQVQAAPWNAPCMHSTEYQSAITMWLAAS